MMPAEVHQSAENMCSAQFIYMPFNHGENHWLCLNINMEKRVAYLFDSSRCIDTDEDRKNKARLLLQSLHKLLQYAHGEDYVQDVSSFAFQWLEDMPRQHNSYDCGLFVIKYMQGKPLPSGVIKNLKPGVN
ncbi:ubiquitin-like-specific protease ESD4 isoform X3 [Camellia sinensis]|uniref:ubiquitin-like-specific protease ESD4 isoform X3 n=1 Tax=Camellia sinensis TaxID=4442 RepID=UPI001036A599|nr:ubiquitin-like-specific protease ESD4 isoform X3 [Camellia sinensis]